LEHIMAVKQFLQFKDFNREEFEYLFERTRIIKQKYKSYQQYWPLSDRTLVMIFEKASTRTRLSFEAGMQQLGGTAIYLNTSRLAARTRRTCRGCGPGHFAHVRYRDDPHLRAIHHRTLCSAIHAYRSSMA